MSSSGYHLICLVGAEPGQVIDLKPALLCIGRGRPNETRHGWLLINDPTVSRHHANLNWVPEQNAFYYEHVSQTNPSRIDGNLIRTSQDLGARNQLNIGTHIYLLERKAVDVEPPPSEAETLGAAQPPDSALEYTLQLLPNGFTEFLKKGEANTLGMGVHVNWDPFTNGFVLKVTPGARATLSRNSDQQDEARAVSGQAVLENGDVITVDFCQFRFRRSTPGSTNTETIKLAKDSDSLIRGFSQVKLVGQGTFGQVFHMKDHAGASVAVKFLSPHLLLNEEAQVRFKNEATVALSLKHNRLLRVFDVGEAEDGRMYIMSEYLPNGTLEDKIQKAGKLPTMAVLKVAHEISQGLEYLHAQNLVHRDIKPSNIFFRDGQAVLADFGIVKGSDLMTATRSGFTAGTPHYMSPEQFRGFTEPRSDQYSLGAMLYEMLAGRRVFDAPDPIALAYMHVHQAPDPLLPQCPGAPEMLCLMIEKMISKKPSDRFANMQAVKGAIEHIAKDIKKRARR